MIYNSDPDNGLVPSDAQKKAFQNMLTETTGLYGQVGIKFVVTNTTGVVSWDAGGLPTGVGGSVKGALNVFVFGGKVPLGIDKTGGGAGSSGIQFGKAFSFIGMERASHYTLSHELTHHFLGDTTQQRNAIVNSVRDTYINHWVIPHIKRFADTLRGNASSGCFTGPGCP